MISYNNTKYMANNFIDLNVHGLHRNYVLNNNVDDNDDYLYSYQSKTIYPNSPTSSCESLSSTYSSKSSFKRLSDSYFTSRTIKSMPTIMDNLEINNYEAKNIKRSIEYASNKLKNDKLKCINESSNIHSSDINKSLLMDEIVTNDLNSLVNIYSGTFLIELLNLDLYLLAKSLFGTYSIEYYNKSLPSACNFFSNIFELFFNENELTNIIEDKLWILFESILVEITNVFELESMYNLKPIPTINWIIYIWNKYNFFIHINKKNIKYIINNFLFSIHINNDIKYDFISIYYFKFLSNYGYISNSYQENKKTTQSSGFVLYVLKVTKKALSYLDIECINDFSYITIDRNNNYHKNINFFELINLFKNLNKEQIISTFKKAMQIIIANYNFKYGNNSHSIPANLFLIFFNFGPINEANFQIILVYIISAINNVSQSFLDCMQKRLSIIHIVQLLLNSLKNSSNLVDKNSAIEILLRILEFNVNLYLFTDDYLKASEYINDQILSFTKEILLFKSVDSKGILNDINKNKSLCLSNLYKLYCLLIEKSYGMDEYKIKSEYINISNNKLNIKSKISEIYVNKNEHEKKIKNFGNTCYFNSVIQCLSLSYYFIEWLIKCKYIFENNKRIVNKNDIVISRLLINIVSSMMKDKSDENIVSFNVAKLIKQVSNQFDFGKQHDASELLRYLLTNIESLNNDLSMPFLFEIEDLIQCNNCMNTKIRKYKSVSILDLNVKLSKKDVYSLRMNNKSKLNFSIESIIEDYFSKENINNNKGCDNCIYKNNNVTLTKWLSITKPVKYIILTIHNYIWNGNSNIAIKNNFVKIDLKEVINIQNKYYEIYAFVFHRGNSINSGHYYAIGKKHQVDKITTNNKFKPDYVISENNFKHGNLNSSDNNYNWYMYDDEIISKIDSFKQIQNINDTPFLIFAKLIE
ncbi:hypothetical protein FG379_000263 [Cryptosporidium bovis]|uniref:uncharacterized protein n=1 Tax=Cryptosporidium bovis TaxID=310047 RepID=UPI003519F83C|nr:hypothetical protein FG379_000263 [Cryptosporidium bovis]